MIELPVAVLNHGNTVKFTEYSFLANVFAARGYHSLLLAGLPALRKSRPLYPTIRTSTRRADTSLMGHKATFAASLNHLVGASK
jgi:hypothetical protein